MLRNLQRIFLISLLALVMTGGSFVVSMAAVAESTSENAAAERLDEASVDVPVMDAPSEDEPEPEPEPEPEVPDFVFDPSMLNASHSTWEIEEDFIVPPTCTEDGIIYHVRWCKWHYREVATSYTSEPIPALGHELGEWTVTKEPTTEEEGLRERFCLRDGCDYSESEPIEKLEEIVVEPTMVSINDRGDIYIAYVDDKGNARFKNFFEALDKDAEGSETITMAIGGKSYTFSIASDGNVTGKLPKGFKVSGRDLIVSGVTESLEVSVEDRTAISGTSWSPGTGEGSVGGDDSYWAPVPEGVVAGEYEAPSDNASSYTGYNYGGYNDDNYTGYTGYTGGYGYDDGIQTADANAASGNASDANTRESSLDTASLLNGLFDSSKDSTSGGLTLGSGNSDRAAPSKLLIAADLALITGLIAGIITLLKLGVVRKRRN